MKQAFIVEIETENGLEVKEVQDALAYGLFERMEKNAKETGIIFKVATAPANPREAAVMIEAYKLGFERPWVSEIPVSAGLEIEDALEKLKRSNGRHFINFNNQVLTPEMTLNDAYTKITGKTKAEHDALLDDMRKTTREREEKFASEKDSLIEHYINGGLPVIKEGSEKDWRKMIAIRMDDIYGGFELKEAIAVMKTLKETDSLEQAYKAIQFDDHSGYTMHLTVGIVSLFAEKGKEFEAFFDGYKRNL